LFIYDIFNFFLQKNIQTLYISDNQHFTNPPFPLQIQIFLPFFACRYTVKLCKNTTQNHIVRPCLSQIKNKSCRACNICRWPVWM